MGVVLHDGSGHALSRWGEKARVLPLNAAVRQVLVAIRSAPADRAIFRGKRAPHTDPGVRNVLAMLGRRPG